MPRREFDKALQALVNHLLELGDMVDKAIERSIEQLTSRDIEGARQLARDDSKINAKRFAIEESCLLLLATQQPMARDLRIIAAIMAITTDLERMGDHAEGTAKITIMLGQEPLVMPLVDIAKMDDKARDMLHRSLKAFVAGDVEAAKAIAAEDDEVDRLNEQVYGELIKRMIENPETIQRATYLLWVSHNLERIADRVTNICERIVFMVTGRMEEMNVSKY
ncbi:MAG: phosphate signaling complex protein PhoU [Dehalococcoidia bacterium]|nr:phosphate signaling complex protein PhoU [Dehalococcoidia bacterium]